MYVIAQKSNLNVDDHLETLKEVPYSVQIEKNPWAQKKNENRRSQSSETRVGKK